MLQILHRRTLSSIRSQQPGSLPDYQVDPYRLLEDDLKEVYDDIREVSLQSELQNVIVVIILVGKPEGRRPLGRPRRRWVDNIRMDLQEVGCVYRDWFGLAQDRDRWRKLVSAVMNIRVP